MALVLILLGLGGCAWRDFSVKHVVPDPPPPHIQVNTASRCGNPGRIYLFVWLRSSEPLDITFELDGEFAGYYKNTDNAKWENAVEPGFHKVRVHAPPLWPASRGIWVVPCESQTR